MQVRRETRTVSLSEIPLVIGLFLASPLSLVVGRLVGSAAVLIFYRRSPPLKTAFNLALFSRRRPSRWPSSAAGPGRPGDTGPGPGWPPTRRRWPPTCIGSRGRRVIAVYEGAAPAAAVLREAVAQPVQLLACTVALVAVTSLSAAPESGWLLVAFGAMLLLGFRSYAGLAERHEYLERLSRFSQAVGRATQFDEVMTSVLSEARQLLRAERASAAFVTADGELLARVRLGPRPAEPLRGPGDGGGRRRAPPVLDSGAPLVMPRTSRDPDGGRWLDQYGMRDAVAVSLGGARASPAC